ncbi:hypothetical protein SMICM17S_09291 [Streptomyces microflavus]
MNGNYEPEQGESRAHTYHSINALNTLGAPDMTVNGDLPTSAVFSKNGTRTYTAHNHSSTTRTVTFSDGKTLSVPARSTATSTGPGGGNPDPEEPEEPEEPGNPSTGNTFRLKTGGVLTTATTDPAGADTIASADGLNRDGTPYRPTVYQVKQVNGKVSAGAATAFRLRVDAGTKVGLAPQVRVSYDLTGDGTFDRTEEALPLLRDRPGRGLGGVHAGRRRAGDHRQPGRAQERHGPPGDLERARQRHVPGADGHGRGGAQDPVPRPGCATVNTPYV